MKPTLTTPNPPDSMKTETKETLHTPGAIAAAEAITGGQYGSPKLYSTSYGRKTVEGIADIIDGHTGTPDVTATEVTTFYAKKRLADAAPELLEALQACDRMMDAIGSDLPAWAMKTYVQTKKAIAKAEATQ